jgi:hypothetical protein
LNLGRFRGAGFITGETGPSLIGRAADATYSFAGNGEPLLESQVSRFPLERVANNRVTGEAASLEKPVATRTAGRKQASQGETKIVSFRDLKERQHAFASGEFAGSGYLFSQGEEAGLSGHQQHAEAGFAAEPFRPLNAAVVRGEIESVTRQGTVDQACQTFHRGSLNQALGFGLWALGFGHWHLL